MLLNAERTSLSEVNLEQQLAEAGQDIGPQPIRRFQHKTLLTGKKRAVDSEIDGCRTL